MPTYLYRCERCGDFECRASFDDRYVPCEWCSETAERHPYSGNIMLKQEAGSIPDPAYHQDKQFRDLRASGWDGDRALSLVRKNIRTDGEGHKYLDTAGMK